jgi:hypothetical protein
LKGYNGESHFALWVVAEAIYKLLGDIMPQIHALQTEVKYLEQKLKED